MESMKKVRRLLIPLLLVLLIIPLEILIDLALGDGDGRVTTKWLQGALFYGKWGILSLFIFVLARKFLRLKLVLVNIGVFLALLLALDFTIFVFLPEKKSAFQATLSAQLHELDDILGYKGCANAKIKVDIKIRNCRTETLTYNLDDEGRRVCLKDTTKGDKTMLFFGCSYTFGVYVNEDSTFPNMFEKLRPEYDTLNYGVGGYGPQMAFLQLKHVTPELNSGKVDAVYTFIDGHVNRLNVSMHQFNK